MVWYLVKHKDKFTFTSTATMSVQYSKLFFSKPLGWQMNF